MRIEIPPQTTSAIWAAFMQHVSDRNAAMSSQSSPALIDFALPRLLSTEEQCWLMSQPLPDPYTKHQVDYLVSNGTPALSLRLPLVCLENP